MCPVHLYRLSARVAGLATWPMGALSGGGGAGSSAVEQRLYTPSVGGSIPSRPTKLFRPQRFHSAGSGRGSGLGGQSRWRTTSSSGSARPGCRRASRARRAHRRAASGRGAGGARGARRGAGGRGVGGGLRELRARLCLRAAAGGAAAGGAAAAAARRSGFSRRRRGRRRRRRPGGALGPFRPRWDRGRLRARRSSGSRTTSAPATSTRRT